MKPSSQGNHEGHVSGPVNNYPEGKEKDTTAVIVEDDIHTADNNTQTEI